MNSSKKNYTICVFFTGFLIITLLNCYASKLPSSSNAKERGDIDFTVPQPYCDGDLRSLYAYDFDDSPAYYDHVKEGWVLQTEPSILLLNGELTLEIPKGQDVYITVQTYGLKNRLPAMFEVEGPDGEGRYEATTYPTVIHIPGSYLTDDPSCLNIYVEGSRIYDDWLVIKNVSTHY